MSSSPAITPRPGCAERLSQMIQLQTVSAELESRGPEVFEQFVLLLEELYPLVHNNLARERVTEFGLVYHWPGKAHPTEPAVLMAHYDVVPVDERDAWTHPPFAGVVEDGWVYGRGALDDKGPLLVVLEAVENLLAAGFVPARDVYLSFGGNEETFGGAAEAIAALFKDRGLTPWIVLDEGGAVVTAPFPGVHGTAAMIGVSEKGIMTVSLEAVSDGGHASAPPPLTAVGRVARAVSRLHASTFPARTPRAVSDMLRALLPQTKGATKAALSALAASPQLTARAFVAAGGEPAAMVRTTIAPTMLSGGTAANVLPSQASATINLRLALGTTPEDTVRRIVKRINDPEVSVRVLDQSAPSPESPTDNAQFALIGDAVHASHPDAVPVPYVMMAATDSRHFHRNTQSVYRFAPLAMSAELRASIHGIDERVQISELERGERFHRTLLQRLP